MSQRHFDYIGLALYFEMAALINNSNMAHNYKGKHLTVPFYLVISEYCTSTQNAIYQ